LSGPLQQKLHPKCANPGCATAFHSLGGGQFYRFPVESAGDGSGAERIALPVAAHHVRHFWLCEHCSSVLRLSYDADRGVVFGLRWPELPGDPRVEITGGGEAEGDALNGHSTAPGETRA
jgi:hypothetical protein